MFNVLKFIGKYLNGYILIGFIILIWYYVCLRNSLVNASRVSVADGFESRIGVGRGIDKDNIGEDIEEVDDSGLMDEVEPFQNNKVSLELSEKENKLTGMYEKLYKDFVKQSDSENLKLDLLGGLGKLETSVINMIAGAKFPESDMNKSTTNNKSNKSVVEGFEDKDDNNTMKSLNNIVNYTLEKSNDAIKLVSPVSSNIVNMIMSNNDNMISFGVLVVVLSMALYFIDITS